MRTGPRHLTLIETLQREIDRSAIVVAGHLLVAGIWLDIRLKSVALPVTGLRSGSDRVASTDLAIGSRAASFDPVSASRHQPRNEEP
jgi:hypothetical protein